MEGHGLALASFKKTLDENHFQTAQKTTSREALSFKIGGRVYFKNKQPGKWDIKWSLDINLSVLTVMDTTFT